MTRAERRALLSDTELADARRQAAEAPAPPPEVVERLRLVLAPAAKRIAAEREVADAA